MKLTPIHVRGKRKSDKNRPATGNGKGSSFSQPNSGSGAASPTLLSSSSLKRSRSSSSAALEIPSLPSSSASASASAVPLPLRRARVKKQAPFDQRFPLEVIERIFFHSMNFNLPRASPRLGWMLSSRHTLRDLVVDAFGPLWALTMVKGAKGGYREPKSDTQAAAKKALLIDSALQTAVLACPWAKMDLLVEAQQIWLQQNSNKRYLHVAVPWTECPDRSLAAKFVQNLDSFDALVYEHPADHIISFPTLDAGCVQESDEDSEEDSNEDSSEDEVVAAGDSKENNDDKETLISAHTCFAIDQYYALEEMYRATNHDPKSDKSPSMLLVHPPMEPHDEDKVLEAVTGVDLFTLRMSVSIYKRGPGLGQTQIPEWLQLAGGPYPASYNQNPQGRKALRDRLRTTFDTLLWVVLAGGNLQEKDSWELTWQGFQYLLAVDVQRYEWDAYDEGEEVVAGHHSHDAASINNIRLQYSVDALVAGLIGLLYALGAFYKQWPDSILASAMELATRLGADEEGAFRKSQTYRTLQRIALLCSPPRSGSPVEWLAGTWEDMHMHDE